LFVAERFKLLYRNAIINIGHTLLLGFALERSQHRLRDVKPVYVMTGC
jgi:hypothetical protein